MDKYNDWPMFDYLLIFNRISTYRHGHNTSNQTFSPGSIILLKFVENYASRVQISNNGCLKKTLLLS